MKRAWFVVAMLACGRQAHWPPRPAENPPTAKELAFYELTVQAPDPAEKAEFAQALSAHGFNVVNHPPYKNQLEVTLTREDAIRVATLRSDGFFVDEALGQDFPEIAQTFAVSQRVTDFIRNSGLPQQHNIPNR